MASETRSTNSLTLVKLYHRQLVARGLAGTSRLSSKYQSCAVVMAWYAVTAGLRFDDALYRVLQLTPKKLYDSAVRVGYRYVNGDWVHVSHIQSCVDLASGGRQLR